MWCEKSQKRCASCERRVCARHMAAANGCCRPCLDAVQEAVREGRCTSQEEDEAIEAIGGPEAAIYGEITSVGFRSLARRVGLGESDVFADLGSGLGRVVVQAAREFGVERACGIEFAQSRHELAVASLEREADDLASRIVFTQADCADPALWAVADLDAGSHGAEGSDTCALSGVTVVYASNLLFGQELMARLAARLEACHTVRAVASLRPWEPNGLAGFHEQQPRVMCETSWRAPEELQQVGASAQYHGSLVYIYLRDGA